MSAVVDTCGVVVEFIVLSPTKTRTAVIEPLKALAQGPSVIELVDQVVDVTKGVSSGDARSILGVQKVGLADVGQLVCQVTDQHDVLDASSLVGVEALGFAESAQDRVPEERPAIVDFGLDTANVSIAVVFET